MLQENHQPDISNIMKNPMKPPCSSGFSYSFPWFSMVFPFRCWEPEGATCGATKPSGFPVEFSDLAARRQPDRPGRSGLLGTLHERTNPRKWIYHDDISRNTTKILCLVTIKLDDGWPESERKCKEMISTVIMFQTK